MQRTKNPKPDPYACFVDDDQRRRALGTRVRWSCTAAMVAALTYGGQVQKFMHWVAQWIG